MTLTIESTRAWAEAVAALPAAGPLPCRTVLVPRERVAHALRRELCEMGRGEVLAGARFVLPVAAAIEVLHAAGVDFDPREDARRRARVAAVFRSSLSLAHFSLTLLRDKPGWDEAFASTISDLEAAGLRPEDLESGGGSARSRDVASVWKAVDASAGTSWTTKRVLLEAARRLGSDPRLWPHPGAVLAVAPGDLDAAYARFVRAVPGVVLGISPARPARERHVARVNALLGERAAEALHSSRAPRASATERDVLASFLFEPPSVLADPSRARSRGPDGTVDLEEHAGVEAEVEATADWVVRQIAAGAPLEEIAILVPAADPLVGLVAERLARLPWNGGPMPVHVAGGLPLAGSPAGARMRAVVSALRENLPVEALAAVLPVLRSPGADGGRHLSHGAAMDLAWSLGTVGGNPANPAGALSWSTRAVEREAELERELEAARAAEEAGAGSGRRARDIERVLTDLRAVRPAVDALVGVARHVTAGAALDGVWPALRDLFERWLLQPGDGPRMHALLDEALDARVSDRACASATGAEALRAVEEVIGSTRIGSARFGEPAVYVGTLRAAEGLAFRAVRVLGLSEGHLPSVPREDPVVPDVVREKLGAPTAADRALEDLHALDRAVRSASERVALSLARTGIERSQREPSSVILEAAAALGRPHRTTGEAGPVVPDATALRRDAFAPAREAAARLRRERPIGETAWQDAVAGGAILVPPTWRGRPSLDLERAAGLRSLEAGAGPLDGILGAASAGLPLPGLTAERPISPSGLGALLACAHAFLLENVLGFGEPAAPPPKREIGQPYYGNLFHAAASEFYEHSGAAFCAGEGSLADWLARADEVATRIFGEFLRQYPLAGEAVRARQRDRLRRDVRDLVTHDWQPAGGTRRFVGTERGFGRPTPVQLVAGEGTLFVRGRIDRIDVDNQRTLVRDLKTGRAHPRLGKGQDPAPGIDLQIAIYGLVTRLLAGDWGVPERVAAAYTYVGRGAPGERAYRDDFHETLEPEAKRWLSVAHALLSTRSFPRTPEADDCRYCAFRPVCGTSAPERARRLLARVGAGGGSPLGADVADALRGFATLKGMAPAGEEG